MKCGKSINQIERELGYPRNALHNYKNGSEPSGTRLMDLSTYFNTTPEFLMGKLDDPVMTEVDTLFAQLNDRQKLQMMDHCQRWGRNKLKTSRY